MTSLDLYSKVKVMSPTPSYMWAKIFPRLFYGNSLQRREGIGRKVKREREGGSRGKETGAFVPLSVGDPGRENKKSAWLWLPIGIKCLFLDEPCILIDRAGAVSLILGTDGHVCVSHGANEGPR